MVGGREAIFTVCEQSMKIEFQCLRMCYWHTAMPVNRYIKTVCPAADGEPASRKYWMSGPKLREAGSIGRSQQTAFGLQSLKWLLQPSLPLCVHLIDTYGLLRTSQVAESELSAGISWPLPVLSSQGSNQ